MINNDLYGKKYFAEQLRVRKSALRKYIRSFYLRKIASYASGKSLDFGCGTGALLERLPRGSVGIDINIHAVEYCYENGMDVRTVDFPNDPYSLDFILDLGLKTIFMNHVLEHFADPVDFLKNLFGAAFRNNVKRIVIVVPGMSGYRSDSTHRTFIDLDYLEKNKKMFQKGYELVNSCFYPVDIEGLGNVFRYHELHVVYDILSPEDKILVPKE